MGLDFTHDAKKKVRLSHFELSKAGISSSSSPFPSCHTSFKFIYEDSRGVLKKKQKSRAVALKCFFFLLMKPSLAVSEHCPRAKSSILILYTEEKEFSQRKVAVIGGRGVI